MLFTDTHEWIRIRGVQGRVGITAYAKKELGDIVYVQLPEIGRIVKAGEEVVVLESTKAAADIYAPVSGEVIAVNEALKESPMPLNQSPEMDGWLFEMKLSNEKDLEFLIDSETYKQLIDA